MRHQKQFTKECAIDIVKAFHPNKEKFGDIKIYNKYDWVIIEGNNVSIGVSLIIPFYGMGHTINAFQEVFNNGKWKAWRFSDDMLFDENRDVNSLDIHPDILQMILIKHNVQRPTAQEMMDYYYED